MNPFLDESVVDEIVFSFGCNGFGRKCSWTKVFLDESVFGRKCFWMKVFLDEFFFAIWMKVYLSGRTIKTFRCIAKQHCLVTDT